MVQYRNRLGNTRCNPIKDKYGSGHKAPGIVGSGSYNITIVCGPRDMCL